VSSTSRTSPIPSSAQFWFDSAKHQYQLAVVYDKGTHTPESYLALGGIELAKGLKDLSVGLRATYLLLEEAKRMFEQGRSGAANRW
jgi:hypothetical protein